MTLEHDQQLTVASVKSGIILRWLNVYDNNTFPIYSNINSQLIWVAVP